MYIDFHTHAFSEKIAQKAMSNLSGVSGIAPCTDGTVSGLRKKLGESGVDAAVLLPVATKPTQHDVINDWAQSENNRDGIYAFGSVFPTVPEAIEELYKIKERGLYGVKLHPEYQNFRASDKSVYPVYKKCEELGLPVLFHAGYDPLFPDDIHSFPEDYAEICAAFPDLKIILAHLGGMYCWDRVERVLAGKFENLWLDTAVIAGEIGDELLTRIIRKHGADKILFASDCPWDDPSDEKAMITSLEISAEEKELIFHKNAESLLKL